MHDSHALAPSYETGLGVYYFLVAFMNLGFAAYFHFHRKNALQALIWTIVAGVFAIHGVAYLTHHGWILPESIKNLVNDVMNPTTYFLGAVFGLAAFLFWRRSLTEPVVAWSIMQAALLFSGWAMTDDTFKAIITKPDNVPIVMLIFCVGFFTWLALRGATMNDERLARGEPPLEKLEDEKVL